MYRSCYGAGYVTAMGLALQGAKSQQELAKLVAENLLAFDSQFWLRTATRADAAESREDKERLTALANVRRPPFACATY